MGREIKFRAWNGVNMLSPSLNLLIESYSGNPVWQFGYDEPRPMPDAILMQYTGLKDKNGVEIYEGDIVAVMGYDYTFYDGLADDDIRWTEDVPVIEKSRDVVDLSCFRYWLKNESFGYEGEDLISPKNCIIIGNIHQNPELL